MLAVLAAAPAVAQQQPVMPAEEAAAPAGAALSLPLPQAARTTVLAPRLALRETLTSNSTQSRNGRAEAITQIEPGVQVRSQGGRVRGFADYSLLAVLHARERDRSQLRNLFNGSATAEVVQRHAFVDASANVSQQLVSPFGTQSDDPRLQDRNVTEVRTWRVAPRLQGRLGADLSWLARLGHTQTHSTAGSLAGYTFDEALLRLGNQESPSRLGWTVDATREQRDFENARSTRVDRLRGVLDYRWTPGLSTGVIAGREFTDVTTGTRQRHNNHGARLNWATDRTRVALERERRFFGDAHTYSLSYRFPRSAWTYTDKRILSNGLNQPLLDRQSTLGEVAALLFASEPDPVLREQRVRDFLGPFDARTPVVVPVLGSGLTAQRQQQLSWVWRGARDTLTFTALRSEGERVDTAQNPLLDAFSPAGLVNQQGLSVALARQLTSASSLQLGLSQRRSSASAQQQTTRLRTATAQWSTALAPRASFSLLGRHSRFDSTTQPYTETALTAALGLTY